MPNITDINVNGTTYDIVDDGAVRTVNNVSPTNGNVDVSGVYLDEMGVYQGATPINADLLEGHDADYFQEKLVPFLSEIDLNDIKEFYVGTFGSGCANIPRSGYTGSLVCAFTGDGTYGTQTAILTYNGEIYVRTLSNGTWGTWNQVPNYPVFNVFTQTVTVTQNANTWGQYTITNNIPTGYSKLYCQVYTASTATGRNNAIAEVTPNWANLCVYTFSALSSEVFTIRQFCVKNTTVEGI